MKLDIAFKDYRKDDIHGTVLYPAMMVAPVQKLILEKIFKEEQISSVFDPFHGSGTALYESYEIDKNINLFGCDINPLANLITTVKLNGIPRFFKNDMYELECKLKKSTYFEHFSFHNIEKWFRSDIIESLSLLRDSITGIKHKTSRLYFWYTMCNIIRKYSNTRTSTYKLHVKKTEEISKMTNNVIHDFINSSKNNILKFNKSKAKYKLYKDDILKISNTFFNDQFDITITSPPYGDNGTTVPYGQFSSLALQWIPDNDLVINDWERENYSIIDTKSLGGSRNNKNTCLSEYELDLIKEYIVNIRLDKQRKVINFFIDYFFALRQMCRYTKKYIILTLGNRTVDGMNIDLTKISSRYLEDNGFMQIALETRNIVKKRTPKLTSKVGNISVPSMNEEFIIIHKSI